MGELEYCNEKGEMFSISISQLIDEIDLIWGELNLEEKYDVFSEWCYDREYSVVSANF